MKNKLNLYLFFLILNLSVSISIKSWTWLYSTNFDNKSPSIIKNKDYCQWTKSNISPFCQLICSWNGYRNTLNNRPLKGHFSFWVQVRNSKTKRWYDWHEIAHWGKDLLGKNIQRSFYNKLKNGTEYHYVRLELPKGQLADAFRVKIKFHNNADISAIRQITVNTTNQEKFTTEVNSREIHQLSSVIVPFVPFKSQKILKHPDADSLCSPTSISMLLGFLDKKNYDPIKIANGVYDYGLGVYGSWSFNIAHAFEVSSGKAVFHVERLSSFKELHKHLIRHIPVIVSIRGPLLGSASPYANGHLLLVVGYDRDSKKVLCHDPAFKSDKKTKVSYNIDNFLKAWERSHRLSYIAIKT